MIVTIIGARPQFIKAAVVSKALIESGIEEKIIHTGQHYDEKMSNVFWEELGIPPYEINLKVGSKKHGAQTAEMIQKIETYFEANRKKIKGVLLYGDTNSTLAGSIVASKMRPFKIIHIEAGLRSFNRDMPEEINRIVTDHLSDILFCSSQSSVDQLKKEGIKGDIYDVGDVMYDAVNIFSPIAEKKVAIEQLLPFKEEKFALVTIHRPSNTDHPTNLKKIITTLDSLEIPCLWPVHPRNNAKLTGLQLPSNLHTIPPVSYFEMLKLLSNCNLVLTDSGGLQKEAYWKKKQCITLREETEWIETIRENWNTIVGPNPDKIKKALFNPPIASTWVPLYGKGDAATRIAKQLKASLYN